MSQRLQVEAVAGFRGIPLLPFDFEVSWAGENADGGLCFGSEDGRVIVGEADGSGFLEPIKLVDSGESVNGVAFASQLLAVSTRCDVVFIDLKPRDQGGGTKTFYDGGTHGVLATSMGGVVAPLGPAGILSMRPSAGPIQPMKVSSPAQPGFNLTKLAHLSRDGHLDVFACAAGKNGVLAVNIGPDGPVDSRYFRAPGLDVADVTSLSSPDWPFAAVALGADHSLHFCRDLRTDVPLRNLSFEGLRGTAYSILQAKGHLFLLTSEALYAFPGLAARFLKDEPLAGAARAGIWPIRAVEAYVACERLLIVMPERVFEATIEEVVDLCEATPTTTLRSNLVETPWESPHGVTLAFDAAA